MCLPPVVGTWVEKLSSIGFSGVIGGVGAGAGAGVGAGAGEGAGTGAGLAQPTTTILTMTAIAKTNVNNLCFI